MAAWGSRCIPASSLPGGAGRSDVRPLGRGCGLIVKTIAFLSLLTVSVLGGTAMADVVPRPEHPRPDFQRDLWLNLNGRWDFDFDAEEVGEKEMWFAPGKHAFSRRILVPFPWESKLSEIGDVGYKGAAWYQRELQVPLSWKGKRVFLKFGAVDWKAKVWIGSKLVGEHEGGYTPFKLDVTNAVTFGGTDLLTVRAYDTTDPSTPTGKQTGWYTRSSGIWQTVYLEAAGPSYIRQIRIQPDVDEKKAYLVLGLYNDGGPQEFEICTESLDGQFRMDRHRTRLASGDNAVVVTLKIPRPKLWEPDSPNLVPLRVSLKKGKRVADAVETYFGMRKVSRGKYAGREYEYIFLNDHPIYLLGALDQSFNPWGIYTFPSDEAIRDDIQKAKEFGLNFLRIHIKVPEPRLVYWADKLGVLLMCDMPNFSRYDEEARANWRMTFEEAVARDFNHPSIFSWCLFNETWGLQKHDTPEGQKWVAEMYNLAKSLDRTRLIEDNSPCRYDHVKTDINSWHFYINDYRAARNHIADFVEKAFPGSTHNYIGEYKQGIEPVINSEYGGISAGMGDRDISWCLKYLTNELRLHEKICGYIYTEHQDIEWEHNGMMDYDRKPKEFGYSDLFPGFTLRSIHNPDFVVIDSQPCPTLPPGGEFSADIYMSHYSRRKVTDGTLKWRLEGTDTSGKQKRYVTGGKPISFSPYSVTKVHTLKIGLPEERSVATLAVWVEGDDGAVLARNYINIDIYGEQPPARSEFPGGKTCVLRFDPGDYADSVWAKDWPNQYEEKVSGLGSGKLTYELNVPDGIDVSSLKAIEILFEGASRAGLGKVDARMDGFPWSRKRSTDYPQTDTTKWPTDVTVRLNGHAVETVRFADDPADARGILSHAAGKDPGSYGYLTQVKVTGESLSEVIKSLSSRPVLTLVFEVEESARFKGGFALYGDRLGRYAVDPTITLVTAKEIDTEAAKASPRPTLAVQSVDVIRTAIAGNESWKYTFVRPGEGWETVDFDDAEWKEGASGFGNDPGNLPSAQAGQIRTSWNTPDIWLRKVFGAPEGGITQARLSFSHDEDMEVFVNGVPVLSRKGHIPGYEEDLLPRASLESFRAGKNVIAVHCRQTVGGQFIDVGLAFRCKQSTP
jgi:hypothetical protein